MIVGKSLVLIVITSVCLNIINFLYNFACQMKIIARLLLNKIRIILMKLKACMKIKEKTIAT